MKASSGGGRAAVRSVGKLLDRYRKCGVIRAHDHQWSTNASGRVEFAGSRGGRWGDGLREGVRLMQRALPATTSSGRQFQQEHGFLSIGDGDEESGLSKHFEEDRVFGYVIDFCSMISHG